MTWAAPALFALRSIPGCSDPVASDFTVDTLMTRDGADLKEPIHMALDRGPGGDVDIWFTERYGKLRKYDGATRRVADAGSVTAATMGENGLLGIALDPGFKSNRRLYLYYVTRQGGFQYRVSRFTLAGDRLDPASEKPVIAIPTDSVWHTGGALGFDLHGDLWITVGEAMAGEGGPSNTNSLLGKILRIHPEEDGTYSIPVGNLYPPGTPKTRPEVYIMGNENPFTIALDPATGWMAWGEIGPDGHGLTEELNIATRPGNHGWPYFAGNYSLYGAKNPLMPINDSKQNTGRDTLPPAIPGSFIYPQSAAITGPIFRYDPANAAGDGLPPHFDGLWFATDFNPYGGYAGRIDTLSLDANAKPGPRGALSTAIKLDRPLDFQQGPDGALYILNYGGFFSTTEKTAFIRVGYHGSCHPMGLAGSVRERTQALQVSGLRVRVWATGACVLRVHDLSGALLYERNGAGEIDLAAALPNARGVCAVTLETTTGRFRVKAVFAPR